MSQISFQADDNLKQRLKMLAKQKGINTSACIKLILKKELDEELGPQLEDVETLHWIRKNDPKEGPFESAKELIEHLNS